MYRTKTTVSNLALREIGTYRIEDFDTEDSAEAEVLRDLWEDTLNSCLSIHEWRFAMKSGRLQQTDFVQSNAFDNNFSGDFVPTARHDYGYLLPNDFIRLSTVSEYQNLNTPLRDFCLLSSNDGFQPIITSNCETLYVEYVSRVENPASWPPHFVDYFVGTLASRIASPLKSTIEKNRLVEYADKTLLPRARSIDSTQQAVRAPPLGSWIRSMRMGN